MPMPLRSTSDNLYPKNANVANTILSIDAGDIPTPGDSFFPYRFSYLIPVPGMPTLDLGPTGADRHAGSLLAKV